MKLYTFKISFENRVTIPEIQSYKYTYLAIVYCSEVFLRPVIFKIRYLCLVLLVSHFILSWLVTVESVNCVIFSLHWLSKYLLSYFNSTKKVGTWTQVKISRLCCYWHQFIEAHMVYKYEKTKFPIISTL